MIRGPETIGLLQHFPRLRAGLAAMTLLTAGAVVDGVPQSVVAAPIEILDGSNPIQPNERRCVDVSGNPGDAALLNLTPVNATGPGNGQVFSSDVVAAPVASNVNFALGSIDPNVGVSRIGADGRICYQNSAQNAVDLVVDDMGSIIGGSYKSATPEGAPNRVMDTRDGLGGSKIQPNERRCVDVSGNPGDAALLNLTPVNATGPGNGQVFSSDVVAAPVASNVNFALGSIDPNVGVSRIGADGRICYQNSAQNAVDLVVDDMGSIIGGSYKSATPEGAPNRVMDTRDGLGGSKIQPNERRCVDVSGNPGDAALLNLTPVNATGPGNGQVFSSDVVAAPVASNVNFALGSIDPNVGVSRIGADGRICYQNSAQNAVDLVVDDMGSIIGGSYKSATPEGAPNRVMDTRDGKLPDLETMGWLTYCDEVPNAHLVLNNIDNNTVYWQPITIYSSLLAPYISYLSPGRQDSAVDLRGTKGLVSSQILVKWWDGRGYEWLNGGAYIDKLCGSASIPNPKPPIVGLPPDAPPPN